MKNGLRVLAGVAGLAAVVSLIGVRRRAARKTGTRFPQARDAAGLVASQSQVLPDVEYVDADVIRRRMSDIFPNGYLTALAIIQGVALGFLLSTIQAQWYKHAELTGRVMIVTQALAVFTAIVVVTHRYLLLTIMAQWVPTIFDTVIPYFLGVGEIASALFIGQYVAWWGSTLALTMAAISSYVHSRVRATPRSFGQMRTMYKRFRAITARAIAILSFLAVLSIFILVANPFIVWPLWFKALTPLAVAVGILSLDITGNYKMEAPA